MQLPSPASCAKIVLLSALGGCAAAPPFDAKAIAIEWAAYMQRDYVVQPGDTLTVIVYPDGFEQQVLVPPTGKSLLARLPVPVQVSGRRVQVLAEELGREYRKVFAGEIQVQVSLATLAAPTIYVAGEVRGAGPVPYRPGMTLAQGVSAAGGLRITAKASEVRVLRNTPGQTPRTIRVNLDSILHDAAPDFLLLPGDIVYCQTSGVADVGNWIDLYIRRMIPIPVRGPVN